MKSPFPGMDPYLETHWRDVHASLVIFARGQLNERLPADLRCRVEERVFVETEDGVGRSMYPDVRVIEKPKPGNGQSVLGGVATAEPIILDLEQDTVAETFLEIIDAASGNRVVTVIEFLSLTNKYAGPGQQLYAAKQRELMQAKVSLVEIDLLRGGERVLFPDHRVPPPHRTPYRVCVRRGSVPGKVELYRVPLREPLPAIRVPLRDSDPDIPLELQPLIDQCYREGRYDDIDYTRNLEPPLDAADSAWVDGLLRQAGKR